MSFDDPIHRIDWRDTARWRAGGGRLSLALGAGIGFVLVACYALLWVGLPLRDAIISEGGWVESLSAYLYLVVAASLLMAGAMKLWKPSVRCPRHPFLLTAVLCLFFAREMDFHSRFTGGSFLKTSFYLRDDVSLMSKAIAALVIVVATATVVSLCGRYAKLVRNRFVAGSWLGVLPIAACLLVVFSKSIDMGLGTLGRNGVVLPVQWKVAAGHVEELCELLIPCCFLLMTVVLFFSKSNSVGHSASELSDGEDANATIRLDPERFTRAA
ncbi:hypothetical protein RISK_006249 [Rhodopirellula islandica]|uniref:Transmembrane protein n=1 Tax=Rhodopirellula islandica TaxID=595434 RepID=A0A0J1B4G7_RHOIS|nr:hypothetical protein [Rhodopirellula islandica]KLU01750.1 hypothetical protein RISK_006249 [Rhodopirellula islandica]